MVTIVQGAKSSCRDVRYGVPQGSVLGPILFSLLICNDLPHIIQDEEVDIEMFADDTTIYALRTKYEQYLKETVKLVSQKFIDGTPG